MAPKRRPKFDKWLRKSWCRKVLKNNTKWTREPLFKRLQNHQKTELELLHAHTRKQLSHTHTQHTRTFTFLNSRLGSSWFGVV